MSCIALPYAKTIVVVGTLMQLGFTSLLLGALYWTTRRVSHWGARL